MRLVPGRLAARLQEHPGEAFEILDDKSGMGFPGRPEILFNSEMDPHTAALQPEAAPPGKSLRLRHFRHPEQIDIEQPASILGALGDCELNVIDAQQHHTSPR